LFIKKPPPGKYSTYRLRKTSGSIQSASKVLSGIAFSVMLISVRRMIFTTECALTRAGNVNLRLDGCFSGDIKNLRNRLNKKNTILSRKVHTGGLFSGSNVLSLLSIASVLLTIVMESCLHHESVLEQYKKSFSRNKMRAFTWAECSVCKTVDLRNKLEIAFLVCITRISSCSSNPFCFQSSV
jgi:hypothetical protein